MVEEEALLEGFSGGGLLLVVVGMCVFVRFMGREAVGVFEMVDNEYGRSANEGLRLEGEC